MAFGVVGFVTDPVCGSSAATASPCSCSRSQASTALDSAYSVIARRSARVVETEAGVERDDLAVEEFVVQEPRDRGRFLSKRRQAAIEAGIVGCPQSRDASFPPGSTSRARPGGMLGSRPACRGGTGSATTVPLSVTRMCSPAFTCRITSLSRSFNSRIPIVYTPLLSLMRPHRQGSAVEWRTHRLRKRPTPSGWSA